MPGSDIVTVNGIATCVLADAFFAPDQAWYPRAAVKNGVICAIAQGGNVVLVRDSLGHRLTINEPTPGEMPVCIEPHVQGWLIVWLQGPSGATYGQAVLSDTLTVLSMFTGLTLPDGQPSTAQGFLDVADNGVPILVDTHRTVTLGGISGNFPSTRGPWTVMQDNNGVRVIAWHSGRGTMYEVWRGYTPVPSHLTLLEDSSAVVCPGLTDLLIHEQDFKPYAPWSEPAEPLPPFPPAPINVFPFDWPGVLNVGDVFAWGTFRQGNATELAKVLASAKARKVRSLGYYDGPLDLSQVPASLDVVGIQCYPAKDIAPDVRVALARQDIEACRAKKRPCVLVVAVYTGSGAWPLENVRLLLRGLWALAAEFGVDILPFGNLRPPVHQELIDDLTAMLAAAKGHQAPTPAPTQPSSLELLMAALTLKKTGFKKGSEFPERFIYPVADGKNMSIDSETGNPRPGGLPANGASESFLYTPGSGRAEVDFGSHLYTFLVDESR